jgi:hypothetical protein
MIENEMTARRQMVAQSMATALRGSPTVGNSGYNKIIIQLSLVLISYGKLQ